MAMWLICFRVMMTTQLSSVTRLTTGLSDAWRLT
jgi:hypothetical protein